MSNRLESILDKAASAGNYQKLEILTARYKRKAQKKNSLSYFWELASIATDLRNGAVLAKLDGLLDTSRRLEELSEACLQEIKDRRKNTNT